MHSTGRSRRGSTEVRGLVAYRYADYDTPFWARASSEPGRWHEPGDGPTQYLSLHPDAAWAEKARADELREEMELALLRTRMWVAEIAAAPVADYSTFELAAASGFPPDALIDDDHTRCRSEGRRLRKRDFRGVLSPSSALDGELGLTLFGARRRSGWGRPPVLGSSIPACIVAVGAPPSGLASRVRHYGDPHAGYERYLLTLRAGLDPGERGEPR